MAWIGSASTDLTARASVVATFQAGVQTPVVE
jgi:hypothetical protein